MQQPLHYVGRQARRSDGQATRIAILEASLSLIIKEGIRGIRHRAVATLAKVPLAATTYYFSDIKDLINDALTYFAEKSLVKNEILEKRAYDFFNQFKHTNFQLPHARNILINRLTEFLLEHINREIISVEDRILESAFYGEALRNPHLAEAVCLLDESHEKALVHFFIQLGSSQAEQNAIQIFSILRFFESYYAVRGTKDDHTQLINDTVEMTVRRIVDDLLVDISQTKKCL